MSSQDSGSSAPAESRFDPNSRPARWSAIAFGVIGGQVFLVQPGFVQGMVERLALSEQQAGLVAAAEMTGVAITTIGLSLLAARIDWRLALRIGVVTAAAGHLASAFATTAEAFAALRFLAGLGLGALISLSFSAIGLTRDPDRQFAYYVLWALVYGAVGLVALPEGLALFGMRGVLLVLAGMTAGGWLLVRFMPPSVHSRPAPNEDARELPLIAKCTALAGMLAYNTALGAAWAYYFLIGLASGLDEQATANALGASQVAAIMGSLAALAIGTQFGRLAPLVAGLSSGAASLTLLLGGASLALFAASASIFNFMWNLVLPYILASMSSYDRRGIMVPAAVAVQMVGLAIGPAAGALVVKPGAFDGAVWLSIVLIAVSAGLFIAAALTHRTLLNARAQIA